MAERTNTNANPAAPPAPRQNTAKRPAARPRAKIGEAIPAYGLSDGVRSFRYGLRPRERGVIDRALDILGRYLNEPGAAYQSPAAVKQYLYLQLAGETIERFSVLYLDCQHRGIAFEHHFTGTLAQTSVHPREIVMAALQHRAASEVLCHNHPSGNTQPSGADKALTHTLKSALALVDVRVLDHVIVAGKQVVSMAELELM